MEIYRKRNDEARPPGRGERWAQGPGGLESERRKAGEAKTCRFRDGEQMILRESVIFSVEWKTSLCADSIREKKLMEVEPHVLTPWLQVLVCERIK